MKHTLILFIALLGIEMSCFQNGTAQTVPTGAPLPLADWHRGGNAIGGSIPIGANIFGTAWNSPIYTETNGAIRMRLNGTITNAVGTTAPIARDGFLGLGLNLTNIWTLPNAGPYSLLHLNGAGTFVQTGGYRNWMQTGITFTSNNDLAYIGHRKNGAGNDITDLALVWSDNSGGGGSGPDNLVFDFTAGPGTAGNDLNGDAPNGREIMRMTATGNVGNGPRFNNTFQPASTYHQHQENGVSSWMQITNQTMTTPGIQTAPTAIGPNNGFRWGVLGDANPVQNGNAFIYNQEKRHIIFSTGNPTPTSINTLGSTQERMRITSNENPTLLPTGGYGIYNPGSLPSGITRVSISEFPSAPVTRPMSLLHLGADVGAFSVPGSTDGWRPWMDIGMFVSNGTDNTYIGMKNEGAFDKNDAVIDWGDNEVTGGPDNFRFIFTTKTTSGNNASGPDGLEAIRMSPAMPALASGVFTGIGGDPTMNLYGPTGTNINPTNTLEVNSWGATTVAGGSSGLRFTNLQAGPTPTIPNPGPGVLAVDKNGDVIYVPGGGNGLGNYCGATSNPLVGNDYEIPLNNFNYRFTGVGIPGTPTNNQVGVGYACGVNMPAKFSVFEQFSAPVVPSTTAGDFRNNDQETTGSGTQSYIGVNGISDRAQLNIQAKNIGGNFFAAGSNNNAGVLAVAGATVSSGGQSFGGDFHSEIPGNVQNIGIRGIAGGGIGLNYGVWGIAPVPGGPLDYAGRFDGDLFVNGPTSGMGIVFASDSIFKTNIDTIHNALTIIKHLKPKTFYFDTLNSDGFRFPDQRQYGFLAQNVETILPELVVTTTKPADYDASGTLIHAAVTFKSLNYTAFIAILMKGMQEQQSKIDSLKTTNTKQDSVNTALKQHDSIQDYRLTTLENALNNCCTNNHALQQNSNSNPPSDLNSVFATDVKLTNGQSIVLEQNVPNPFAEQTTINYFLPDDVNKAQMLFYNSDGKLIQSVDLNQRGKGQLNVFASDLTNGMYTYTLVVDGKIIETKKMMKQ